MVIAHPEIRGKLGQRGLRLLQKRTKCVQYFPLEKIWRKRIYVRQLHDGLKSDIQGVVWKEWVCKGRV